jgi:hypothetical protein
LKYIGDISFFLFDSGFSISKESVFKVVDENVSKLPSKEFSILSEFLKYSEILRKFFKKCLTEISRIADLKTSPGVKLDLELLYNFWVGDQGNLFQNIF